MRAVHVCVSHDNNTVVPKLVRIEFVLTDTAAERSNNSPNLCGAQHFIKTRLFDVQYLSLQRKNRLEFTVSTLFSRASSGVPFHQIELTQ